MIRAVPICRAFMAADIAAGSNSVTGFEAGLLCIGSRCSMWHGKRDESTNVNLGCCAENVNAVPWVDPAAKETP